MNDDAPDIVHGLAAIARALSGLREDQEEDSMNDHGDAFEGPATRADVVAFVEKRLKTLDMWSVVDGAFVDHEAGTNDRELSAAYHLARFMQALGLDPLHDAHLAETPARVARLFGEWLHPEPFRVTTFPATSHELIVVRDVPFTALCAHHLMFFTGVAHVGYIPADLIVGLSKIPRIVRASCARPSTQEAITTEIASAMSVALDPLGVGVVVEARHSCMELRGPCAVGATTTTSAMRGALMDEASARAEFFAIVRNGGAR